MPSPQVFPGVETLSQGVLREAPAYLASTSLATDERPHGQTTLKMQTPEGRGVPSESDPHHCSERLPVWRWPTLPRSSSLPVASKASIATGSDSSIETERVTMFEKGLGEADSAVPDGGDSGASSRGVQADAFLRPRLCTGPSATAQKSWFAGGTLHCRQSFDPQAAIVPSAASDAAPPPKIRRTTAAAGAAGFLIPEFWTTPPIRTGAGCNIVNR